MIGKTQIIAQLVVLAGFLLHFLVSVGACVMCKLGRVVLSIHSPCCSPPTQMPGNSTIYFLPLSHHPALDRTSLGAFVAEKAEA